MCGRAMLLTARALLATRGLHPQSEKAALVHLCETFIGTGDLDPGQGRAIRRAFELCRRADGAPSFPSTARRRRNCSTGRCESSTR